MNEYTNLLHNMSAPPKSVVKYTGLSGFATSNSPDGSELTSLKYSGDGQFGKVIRFILREDLRGLTPKDVLIALGFPAQISEKTSSARRLISLINRCAAKLPLPDGCAVIKSESTHDVLWDDPLSALAILSKSSDTVWLRNKSPAISVALQQTSASLLIPPAFIERLVEERT